MQLQQCSVVILAPPSHGCTTAAPADRRTGYAMRRYKPRQEAGLREVLDRPLCPKTGKGPAAPAAGMTHPVDDGKPLISMRAS